jgi:ribosomal protein S18 acetylase RimI-like enzyme
MKYEIDKELYRIGELTDISYKDFENFVEECEETTNNWSFDLQAIKDIKEWYNIFSANDQCILLSTNEEELIAMWSFMLDKEANAVEFSIVIKEEYRGKGLGEKLMILGERYFKANYSHLIDIIFRSIYGRIKIPGNIKWVRKLMDLGYKKVSVDDSTREPGMIFLFKEIDIHFHADLFNKDLNKITGVLK